MERSLLLAKKFDLSAYDACYAVLAQQLEIPLLTVDQPLARKLDFAVFLGDLDISMWQEG
jgi:predicted nucleic acid-binding protein